jgi:hypothetical protein
MLHCGMRRLYVFADEAGDFAFKRGPNISKYFIACSVTIESCEIGEKLLRLRREMAWQRRDLGDYFHATSDSQATRDAVFSLIANESLRIDATILEKSKALLWTRETNQTFYKYAWYYHFKHVASQIVKPGDELQVTIASIGTKKNRGEFLNAITEVLNQTANRCNAVTAFWPAQADPCLQIADYCTWAIQRKWERQDSRSYDLIKSQIRSEFDLWRVGTTHHY